MEETSLKEEYRCGASMRKFYHLMGMLIATIFVKEKFMKIRRL